METANIPQFDTWGLKHKHPPQLHLTNVPMDTKIEKVVSVAANVDTFEEPVCCPGIRCDETMYRIHNPNPDTFFCQTCIVNIVKSIDRLTSDWSQFATRWDSCTCRTRREMQCIWKTWYCNGPIARIHWVLCPGRSMKIREFWIMQTGSHLRKNLSDPECQAQKFLQRFLGNARVR